MYKSIILLFLLSIAITPTDKAETPLVLTLDNKEQIERGLIKM